MRFFGSLLWLCLGVWLVTAQEMTSNGNMRTDPRSLVRGDSEEVLRGADLYVEHCAVCHGDTGLGLTEAKTTFPEEDRDCTRCHRSGNPKTVNWRQIKDNDMFDIGQPPPLRGDGALATFPDAASLHAYIQATMPRYQPGILNEDEYRAITAFLRHINGAPDPKLP